MNGIGKNFGIMLANKSSATLDRNIEISGNDIQDYGQWGMYTKYVTGIDIKNNLVHNDNNTSIYLLLWYICV